MRQQGTPGFNGKRLKQARNVYGLTVTSLAEMIEVSKQAISQFEKSEPGGKGSPTPRSEVLDKISNSLNFPKDFFLQGSYILNESPIHYRSLNAATKAARHRAEVKFIWLQEITNILKQYVELPVVNIPSFNVSDHNKISAGDIENFATSARRHWGLGDGPISNALTLAENNGIIVSRIDLEADTLDALSQWSTYDSTPYIFLSSSKNSAARSRFDIAHEFGHLTFHKCLGRNIFNNPVEHSILEKQAHRFSSAFLMPARTFTNDLISPTLERFWALKEKWQVSIGAMIMRCLHLEIIDEEYARKLWINYNRRGWAKHEPLDDRLPIEQPKILRRSFELLVKENILAREDITSQLPYPITALEEIINLPKGFLSTVDNIEYFPTIRKTQDVSVSNPNDSKVMKFPRRNN
jgi:Zn-dependent peptidase ImmA (M78 family)/transcriptional regulator with XRE-family HTH domain